LTAEGLNEFEDAPAKILQYASQKYSKENSAGFGDKMRVLELKHQKSVEAVFKNPDVTDEFINDQFKESPQVKPQADLMGLEMSGKEDFKLEGEINSNGNNNSNGNINGVNELNHEEEKHEEEKHE